MGFSHVAIPFSHFFPNPSRAMSCRRGQIAIDRIVALRSSVLPQRAERVGPLGGLARSLGWFLCFFLVFWGVFFFVWVFERYFEQVNMFL